jgi:hypothetical protein
MRLHFSRPFFASPLAFLNTFSGKKAIDAIGNDTK